MTSDLEEFFVKYKQAIIAAVVLGALASCILPFDSQSAQAGANASVRSKIIARQPVTSADLFPNGNIGQQSTGSNNVGNNDHGTNINGITIGNENGGTTTNGVVVGNGNHGALSNGNLAGNGNSGTVTGNAIGNNRHITPPAENPPPASPASAQ
jgi:hypothetical protein